MPPSLFSASSARASRLPSAAAAVSMVCCSSTASPTLSALVRSIPSAA